MCTEPNIITKLIFVLAMSLRDNHRSLFHVRFNLAAHIRKDSTVSGSRQKSKFGALQASKELI